MIIELFGLPGSGKSTLMEELVALNSSTERARDYPLSLGWRYIFLHPLQTIYWSIQILIETWQVGTWSILNIKYSLLLHTFAHTYAAQKSTKSIIVDEGMLQRIISSVFETKQTKERMHRTLRWITPARCTIHVVGNETTHFKRYERTDARNIRKNLGPEYLEKWKEAVRHNHALLLDVLEEQSTPLVSYDGNISEVNEVITHIQSHIS